MIQRTLQATVRLNLKYIPKRLFAAQQEAKKKPEADDDNIWEEEEDNEQGNEQANPSKKYLKYLKSFVIWGSLGWLGVNGYYAVKAGNDEEAAKEETLYNHYVFSVSNTIARQVSKGYNYLLYPPVTKFLPDELPIRQDFLRKTLVLNFEGTLYSKDFSGGQGVLIHLRPGFKKFIDKMSQLYDIVLYSNEDTAFMTEVVQTIDPFQKYFMWNLGREFLTTMPDGSYKDLRFINRDPKRFIVVDFTIDDYLNNKENVVLIDNYKGAMEDNSLRELSLFLEHCSAQNIKDVRKEISKYGGTDSVKNYYLEMQKKVDSVKKKRSMLFGFQSKNKLDRN